MWDWILFFFGEAKGPGGRGVIPNKYAKSECLGCSLGNSRVCKCFFAPTRAFFYWTIEVQFCLLGLRRRIDVLNLFWRWKKNILFACPMFSVTDVFMTLPPFSNYTKAMKQNSGNNDHSPLYSWSPSKQGKKERESILAVQRQKMKASVCLCTLYIILP